LEPTGASVSVTVGNPDTVGPTVSMSAPASAATVSGAAVTVSATADDNVGVASVQFLLDGVALGTPDTSAPYSITWNSTTVANGTHTLSAQAADAAGNTTTATARTVTVSNTDTTAPSVSMTAPASGATVSGAAVTVSANAIDNVAVTSVQFLLDGAALGAPDTSAPYSIDWDSTAVSNGTHTLSARASDASGNAATSASVTVTVSNVPAPTAVNDTFLFRANTLRTVNYAGPLGAGVLGNDTDPGNLPLTAVAVETVPTGVTLASSGVVTVNRGTATSLRYRANNGSQFSLPSTGALVTLAIDAAPSAVLENCTYARATDSITSGTACSMTGVRTITVNVKSNDTDPNGSTNVPTDGVGKTVIAARVTSTGTGVAVSANSACGQAAIVKTASRAAIVNNCDGTLTVTVSASAPASPITFTYGAIDDLGAVSASANRATDTITVQ
jgi:hypothetical protein